MTLRVLLQTTSTQAGRICSFDSSSDNQWQLGTCNH